MTPHHPLQEVWDSLGNLSGEASDFDQLWDKLGSGAFESAWEAPMDEEYQFKKENPYVGQSDLLERGTQLCAWPLPPVVCVTSGPFGPGRQQATPIASR